MNPFVYELLLGFCKGTGIILASITIRKVRKQTKATLKRRSKKGSRQTK